jgi:phage gpG-like protein
MPIKTNGSQLSKNLAKRIKTLEPRGEKTVKALNLIGIILRNRMIMEATRQRIVDTGALRNSLNYRINGNTVTVGSFGVPYARFHEFGATLPPAAVRAMFAAMRKRSKTPRPSKGVFTGNPRDGGKLKARPFVTPALRMEGPRIRAIIKESMGG